MALRKWAIGLLMLSSLALMGCNDVVARVNGQDITQKEFHEQLERAQGRQILEVTILRRLVEQRAKAEGLLPTPEEVQEKLKEFRKQNGLESDADYVQWLKTNASDDTALLDQIQFQLTLYKLRTAGMKPTDDELKQFFEEYRGKFFDKPERFQFRQIVLPTKEAAAKLLHQLNTQELIFSDVARKESLDQSTAESGGLIDGFPVDLMKEQAKPIYDALSSLKDNELSQEPIQMGNVYVLLKLLKKLPAEPADVNDPETKKAVEEQYLGLKAKPEEQLLSEVAQNADVVVLADRYKAAIEPRFAPQGQGSNLPPAVQEQLDKGPDMTEPTEYDESQAGRMLEQPAPSQPAPAPAGGGN